MRNVCVVALALLGANPVLAQTFNLTADFSETANPNWQWAFVLDGTPLAKFTSTVSNPLNAAAGNGYWGTSSNSSYESSVLRTTADGPAASLSIDDFLAGDVIAHGANPGHGLLEVRWGGSVRGTAAVSGRTWYAHSSVGRIGLFELKHNTGVLASGQIPAANNRPNPVLFNGGGTITLQAGDTIRLALAHAPGQTFACLLGADLTVTFTPHPCPPDLTYGAIAGQPGYGLKNGIADNDDFFYYLAQFAAGNVAVADLTTGAIPGQPGYGVPNGVINNDDFFYYLGIFAAGCP